jgi:hypothetical protein
MPQIEGGSVSVVVVCIFMVLELGFTKSHTFVWVVICAGGDTNGPPCGRLLWALI